MRQFFKGLSYNLEGFRYFFANPKLWKYVLVPTLINFLALIILVTLYVSYFNDIFLLLTKPLSGLDILEPQNFWGHFFDGTLWIVRQLFKLLVFLVSLILIFVVVFLISSVINAPFYEAMSEKILELLGLGTASTFKGFIKNFVYSLKIEMSKFFIFAGAVLVLFLLSWLPVVGVIFSILMFLFVAWMFAFGLCTYPMVVAGASFTQMLRWGWNHKALLTGFGLPSVIPFLGLFIIFFQIAGGTLLYVGVEKEKNQQMKLTSINNRH